MKYFTMQELTSSNTARAKGLDNTPTAEHARNIEQAVDAILDPLREAWAVRCANLQLGTPAIHITSGYRGFRLNKAVGGSTSSAHCAGHAFDMIPSNGRMADFKAFCREFVHGRIFDQLISEDENNAGLPVWIHIGFKNCQGAQRRQLLTMRSGKYIPMT